ncbi:ADP-ribosylglycohydrolase family protein [Candidatus Riflebacteria bacterium]
MVKSKEKLNQGKEEKVVDEAEEKRRSKIRSRIIDDYTTPEARQHLQERFKAIEASEKKKDELCVAEEELLNKYLGCMMGLAVGDALGGTLEFSPPGGPGKKLTEIVGGGPHNLKPGEWTDDTSMALCLAESLVTKKKFDLFDQMKYYIAWYREGKFCTRDKIFDVGETVAEALVNFEKDPSEPMAGSTDKYSSGNGSLMRLASVPLFYFSDKRKTEYFAGLSSITTHGSKICEDACSYFSLLIFAALEGRTKEEILKPDLVNDAQSSFCEEILPIIQGSYKEKEPPQIRGTGYVVQSLEAALWAFYKSDNFKDGALLAANLGEDADTTTAVYGQLAGAYYDITDIPSEWIDIIFEKDLILEMAKKLFYTIPQDPRWFKFDYSDKIII